MNQSSASYLADLFEKVEKLNKQEAMILLSDMDDGSLWSLYQLGCEHALVILFKKYYRPVIILVYNRLHKNEWITFSLVQESFSDFIEQVLIGKYQGEPLKKNFTAFAIHHLSFIVRSKARLVVNSRVGGLIGTEVKPSISPHLKVEQSMDFRKVIDFIPRVSNNVYRMVLYLVFVMGYNSKDLIEVFGKRERAYDKRSRAIKAFRKLLEREGMLEELR